MLKNNAILLLILSLLIAGCQKPAGSVSTIQSYKDIPGITQEEIAAIEELQKKGSPLIYAVPSATETFVKNNGETGGYTNLLCGWLTDFFGIYFKPEICELSEVFSDLETGKIHFTSLIRDDERASQYLMTTPMVHWSLKFIRLKNKESADIISLSRPVRYVLMEGTAPLFKITDTFEPGTYQIITAKSNEEVYNLLKEDKADIFIAINSVAAAFDNYNDITADDYYPLTFFPVSMAAKDKSLLPVISVIDKALDNGAYDYLNSLYRQGYQNYLSDKFFKSLTEEERDYLKKNPIIPIASQYYAYPTSFYDKYEKKWDGIIFEILSEIEALTGLKFSLIHENNVSLGETVRMLQDGRVYMLPNLIPSEERLKMFLHTENIYMKDRFALLSKRNFQNVDLNDIPHQRIGLAAGSSLTETFLKWFPDAHNYKIYPNMDEAFLGLNRDEVDLVMSSQSRLSSMNNYYGFSEYKANYLFDAYFDFCFWVNKEHEHLCSILDKALVLVDTDKITEQWLTVSYNYEELILRKQRPWLFGVIILFLSIIILVAILFARSRSTGKRLKILVDAQTSTLTAIFNAVPDLIFYKDLQSRYIKCNKSMEDFFNIREQDIIGKDDRAAFNLPEEEAYQFMLEDKKIIEEKRVIYFEEQMSSIQGKPVIFETIKSPVLKGDEVTGIIGIARDITERKTAMEEFQKNKAENEAFNALQYMFSGLDVMVHVTDPKTDELLFLNKMMKEKFNVPDDCTGRLCYKVLRNMNERCGFCPCNQLDKEPDKVLIWEEHDNKTNRFYRNTSRYIKWIDDRIVYFHQSVDITDIRYEIMRYELTRNALGIGLWDMEVKKREIIHPDNIFNWSNEFRNMLGYKDENDFPNILHSWSDKIHPDDKERVLNAFYEHVNDTTGKTPYNVEYRLKVKDGNYRYFHAFGTTLRNNTGEPIRVAGAIEDIEDKKQLHDELEHREEMLKAALEQANAANKAKSDFLSHMSHEMRTPLNAIFGMTAIGKNAANTEQKDYAFTKIEDASSHLLGIIDDVLDMSKIEANKFELSFINFNFDKVIQSSVSVINFRMEQKRQKLILNIDSNIPKYFIGDDQRLSQVITNLLSNAVKFTPEEGEISLNVFVKEEGNAENNDTYVLLFEVTDTGIGISDEQQSRLFHAFEQAESGTSREYGGTGLGLVITKNIVELMGGEIRIESEIGKGSKFIFYVNLKRGEDENTDNRSSGGIGDIKGIFKNRKMLLAEDMEINREILIALLEDTGITIECAENGIEALETIQSFYDKFDIVLMDLQMPKMDGLEATRRIREFEKNLNRNKAAEKEKRLPIIAMTANVFKADIEDCLNAGMDDHIGKPVIIDNVIEKLNKYL